MDRRPSTVRAVLGLATVFVAVAGCSDSSTGPSPQPPGGQLPIEPPLSLRECVTRVSPAGALMETCLPAVWNGEIVAWAHGYVNPGPDRPPGTPLALPADALGGLAIRDVVRNVGDPENGYYGYASTSYRRNGLVAAEGAHDLGDLMAFVEEAVGGVSADLELPTLAYVIGASEGGLATVLALEEESGIVAFDGGLALCGPVGDFKRQIEYLGDFRAVFDYLFPGVMPGTAVGIPDPEATITEAHWSALQDEVRSALASDPGRAAELFDVTGVSLDANDPQSGAAASVQVLRYSFFGTNDVQAVLQGNPFGNLDRVYSGSADDEALNAGIARFGADALALENLESEYETTGRLRVPVVTLHTTRDPVVPYWHEPAYEEKAATAEAADKLTALSSEGYGHCGFTVAEVVAAFSTLVPAVTGHQLTLTSAPFSGPAEVSDFLRLARSHGASPVLMVDGR